MDRVSNCPLNLEIGDRERILARLILLMATASGWTDEDLSVGVFLNYSGCHWLYIYIHIYIFLLAGPLVCRSSNN